MALDIKSRHAYHLTHIENLEGIIRKGLLSVNEQKRQGVNHHSIAASTIQDRRSRTPVPCGPGGVVHDYIPFYLCRRSSMLLSVVNSKNCDQQLLLYIGVPLTLVEREDVIFTDASANTNDPPRFYADPQQLDALDWGAIDSLKWNLGMDQNQARMAELLIHQRFDITDRAFIIAWNPAIRDEIVKTFQRCDREPPAVRFNSLHYFTKFLEASRQSLVAGPLITKARHDSAIRKVLEFERPAPSARFPAPIDLLHALRTSLANLPETAELVGLKSASPMHTEPCCEHTLHVVRVLRESPRFRELDEPQQVLLELAAYLHDIGKVRRAVGRPTTESRRWILITHCGQSRCSGEF